MKSNFNSVNLVLQRYFSPFWSPVTDWQSLKFDACFSQSALGFADCAFSDFKFRFWVLVGL
jgi:hypothetical protein